MDEESDEETEDDARVRQVHSTLIATPGRIQDEGSCDVNARRRSGGGAEARVRDDGEHDEDERKCGSGERREHVRGAVDHMEWEKVAVSGGVGGGSVGGSEMEDEELEDEGGDVGVSAGLTSKRKGKRTAQSSWTPATPKKQARRKAVDEARVALDASQGKLGEADMKCKSSCSGSQNILPIPMGDIAFNQRSLNPTIVAGIEAAIDASTRPTSEDDPAPWDPQELVLALITPSMDENSQEVRILPHDFDPDRANE
ncbi:hypothetical protein CBR_g46339 [Chara braunii]|uniref:Uncharacterized protein n=1 Tax=Chara braunii TaxID=69332 RepID=A0A388M0B3_CHABU|nr:hypothetical protein CBR_g46339 [Chara braunii]|eukprot:GBG87971.1 hypothetical protein CBR_g46339 [Chara braunii]